MRRVVLEVFNDTVYGTTAVFTPTRFNEMLAQFDQIQAQAVTDGHGGTSPTLTVDLEHSNDQRNWTKKVTLINAAALTANQTGVNWGSDSGTTPTGAFARLAITIGGTSNPVAHVKVVICARDGGG